MLRLAALTQNSHPYWMLGWDAVLWRGGKQSQLPHPLKTQPQRVRHPRCPCGSVYTPPGKPSCYVTLSSDTTGTRGKSITFHEALHGFTGLDDPHLYQALTGQSLPEGLGSDAITDYIAHKVFGWPANFGGITQLCKE